MGAASLLGHMALGAAAVMTMALGTAMTVSALARDWVTRLYLKYKLKYEPKHGTSRLVQVNRLGGWLAMAGGIALVWLGLSLAWYATTMPAAGPSLFS
jgi:ABC-type nickel/cobalt efflux system permease component RcnA